MSLSRSARSQLGSAHGTTSSLRNYADSIGVTSYLVRRLVEFPDSELEFYWPQLWCASSPRCSEGRVLTSTRSHLLVTRPTESVALENLILDRCDTSIHLAMLVHSFAFVYLEVIEPSRTDTVVPASVPHRYTKDTNQCLVRHLPPRAQPNPTRHLFRSPAFDQWTLHSPDARFTGRRSNTGQRKPGFRRYRHGRAQCCVAGALAPNGSSRNRAGQASDRRGRPRSAGDR